MAEKLATAAAQKQATEVLVDDPDEEGPRPGSRPTKGTPDPFGAAFDAAEAELTPAKAKKAKAPAAEEDDEDEPAPDRKPLKAKKQADAEDDAKADKKRQAPDKKAADAEKPVAKKPAKAAPADDGDETEEDDEPAAKPAKKAAAGEDDADAEADAEKAKPKGPLTPKNYWARERREAFPYQTREVQEAWLNEAPAPHAHWATDHKDMFAKQPREVQEAWLEHTQSVERGYGRKFEELAGERKLATEIRETITPEIRTQMQQFGLKSEAEVLKGLLHLQQQSVQNPVKYARDFIVRNKLDIRHFIPDDEGNWPADFGGQNGATPQADIESHPVVRQLLAKVTSLEGRLESDVKQREENEARAVDDDMAKIIAERDETGEPRFPYIRLLGDRMAEIIESDPARFGAMGHLDGVQAAYDLALKSFPELPQTKRTATKKSKPTPVEELDGEADDEADSEEDAATVKLKQAATKKSKTPIAAPGTSGDPFDRAFAKAEKQLGTR